MFQCFRRVLVAVLALSMTITLAGAANAAPAFRDKPVATRPNPDVVMRGSGWGHGVGMSQYGAYAQSRAGRGFRRILHHYYSNITVGEASIPSTIRIGLEPSLDFSNVDAVTGDIPWRAKVDGRWVTRVQPEGTTWKVDRNENGLFRLWRGTTLQWKVQTPALIANFNWRKAANGTVVEAYNPNYNSTLGAYRALYKWGRLEYTPSRTRAGAMNMVIDIPGMELYLRGLAESISGWGYSGGMAALRAQAVVGRSYALNLRKTYEAYCRCHMGATPAHQTYKGYTHESAYAGDLWVKAVNDTRGLVAKYQGEPIEAFYSSSHGGRSENIEDSWAYSANYGYLRSVDDPWSVNAPGNPFASWERAVSNQRFAGFLGSDIRKVRRLSFAGRTDGGTPLTLRASGLNSSGGPASTSRTGPKGIVGIAMRESFTYPSRGLSTLPSQQIRSVGFKPFVDDDGSVNEYGIVFAYRAGIMGAQDATHFAPRRVVSRAKAAKFIYNTLRLPAATTDYFDDDDGLAEEAAINALARAGIASRVKSRQFLPRHALTRGQAATFFKRALGLAVPDRDYFTDDNSSPHESAINAMRRKRLMTGCAEGRFCPDREMRRGGMATLLLKTVEAYR